MSLDTLLKRLIETPETPHVSPDVSPKPAWIKAETPETPETPQANLAMESRRKKVLAMLKAAPEINRAIYPDTESDKENVILAIAVRHVATFEMLVPKARYDPWQLMQLMNSAKGLH